MTNCAELEQRALNAAVKYVIAAGQAAGRKIEGEFYTIEYREDKLINKENAKIEWENAVKAWNTACLDRKAN